MKSRPILFSAPMVLAILDVSKTQTRRVVKERQDAKWHAGQCGILDPGPTRWNIGGVAVTCPYGQPGDQLWVRETFSDTAQAGEGDPSWVYRATDPEWGTELEGWKWRPSIFMPRAASRITLEITGIDVERLQDISESDAWQEGVKPANITMHGRMARDAYQELWNKINGPDSWNSNPWVWKISFNRIKP